jgi:hypothetical protein
MDWDKFFESKNFNIALISIGALAVLLVVFKLGIDVGFRKANFSCNWGENYYQNFAGPLDNQAKMLVSHDDFMNPHGVFGEIIKVDDPSLVVKDQNDLEKVVLTKEDTVIKEFEKNLKVKDLQVGENVVIIGAPNSNGQIEAGLIRIITPPSVKTWKIQINSPKIKN